MPALPSCILLIDDDATTNFLNHRLLCRLVPTATILITTSGEQALHLLTNPAQPMPDLVFLGVHLAKLSGWGFLQEFYHQHPTSHPTVVALLTTILNTEDLLHMQTYRVKLFYSKPLTEAHIQQVLQRQFS